MLQRLKGGRRGGGDNGVGRSVTARNDAEEASLDAQAEMDDTAAALNGAGETAGEQAGARAPLEVPSAVLQRKLEKEKKEKEHAINEKALLQKKLDDMAAQLELAKTNVGDVVSVTPTSNKVSRNMLPYCFDFFIRM